MKCNMCHQNKWEIKDYPVGDHICKCINCGEETTIPSR